MQLRELARVAWIGLDPIARPLRHQPRRDHVAVDPARDEVPIQAKAGRARLVTTAHPRPAPHHTPDSLMLIGQRPFLEQLVRAHRRQSHRSGVHIQPDRYRPRLAHGRRPPYVALPGAPRQPTTNECVGADHSPPATGRRAQRGYGSILSRRTAERSYLARTTARAP